MMMHPSAGKRQFVCNAATHLSNLPTMKNVRGGGVSSEAFPPDDRFALTSCLQLNMCDCHEVTLMK